MTSPPVPLRFKGRGYRGRGHSKHYSMSNFQSLSSLIWNVADDVLRELMKKSLGSKRKEICKDQQETLLDALFGNTKVIMVQHLTEDS